MGERQRLRPRGGGGDPPGYVAAIAAAARPLPTRPPTRPLAAGSCAAALPRSDGERQCVLAPHARSFAAASPPRRLLPRTQLLASPAPRRRAGVVAAAGKGCGPRGAPSTPRLPQQVKAEGREAGGGTRGGGRGPARKRPGGGWIPGARSPGGGGPEAGGERRGNPGGRGPGAGRKGSEASRGGGPWRGARGRAKAGAAVASPASSAWRASRPRHTPPAPGLSRVPSRPDLTSRPCERPAVSQAEPCGNSGRLPGLVVLVELFYLLTSKPHARTLARSHTRALSTRAGSPPSGRGHPRPSPLPSRHFPSRSPKTRASKRVESDPGSSLSRLRFCLHFL